MAAPPVRYALILASVALSTTLAAVGGWRYARASAPLNGPVIVISIDSLRADHLPAYGYKNLRTPAIDDLAASGVLFERAYSHAPQTLPAHVALLSGRLPPETGVRDDADQTVKPGERMLAEMLRDRGYETGGVVSTELLGGLAQGFKFFDAEMPADAEPRFGRSLERPGEASEQVAERWLDKVGTSRAFLWLQLNEPHAPYTPPERFSRYSPYDGEIAYTDEIVGRLIHYLKTHQLFDRSTIILVSDHGEGLGEHGEKEHGLLLTEEAIHVPLIIKQEGNALAGHRVADVVQQIDLVPTILDLVKAPIPGNLRGRSLKTLLDGGSRRPELVYSEAMYGSRHFGWSALTAMTSMTPTGDPVTADAPAYEAEKIQAVESYRAALDLAASEQWTPAIRNLQRILRTHPELVEVWDQLGEIATRANRPALAAQAHKRARAAETRPR